GRKLRIQRTTRGQKGRDQYPHTPGYDPNGHTYSHFYSGGAINPDTINPHFGTAGYANIGAAYNCTNAFNRPTHF
ncbi:MAG: hypothetical protein QGI56_08595, partial [Dehalococcoidia bacterium]|nr:hypothetical protein [Dehalococcoidia bacterium]